MENNWKFSDPENTAAFTIKKIASGEQPVLHVSHDVEGDWQFLGLETPDPKDAAIVHLKHFIENDPTIEEMHDLPIGWRAYRGKVGEKWIREKLTEEEVRV